MKSRNNDEIRKTAGRFLGIFLAALILMIPAVKIHAAGPDWSDGTSQSARSRTYTVTFRSGSGTGSSAYTKLNKKKKYGTVISIPKLPSVPAGYQAEGWSLKKHSSKAEYIAGEKYIITKNVTFYAVIKKKNNAKLVLHRNNGKVYKIIKPSGNKVRLPVMINSRNCTFLGWSRKAGQKTKPVYEAGEVITVNGTQNLYEVSFNRSQEPDLTANSFHYPEGFDRIIFVGDSRTYGLQKQLYEQYGERYVDSHVSFVCQSGSEISWLKSTGEQLLMSELEKYKDNGQYAKIAVIFNHGVNDIRYTNGGLDLNGKISTFTSYMRSLGAKLTQKNCELYYMSLNPINGGWRGDTGRRKCEDLRTFNNRLGSVLRGQYRYIDTYHYLMQTGYGTVSPTGNGKDDGTHYTTKTYKRIFAYCLNFLEKNGGYLDIEDADS